MELIEPTHRELSVVRQCDLLKLPRSSWYYQPQGESAEDLSLMRLLDEQYTRTPFYGGALDDGVVSATGADGKCEARPTPHASDRPGGYLS
jgi:hypothetical protein